MLSQATRDREKGKRDGPTCGDDFMWLCIVESRNPATHPNSLIWIWPLQMNPMDAFPNHGNQYLVEPQNNTVKLTYAMPPKRGTPTTTSGAWEDWFPPRTQCCFSFLCQTMNVGGRVFGVVTVFSVQIKSASQTCIFVARPRLRVLGRT